MSVEFEGDYKAPQYQYQPNRPQPASKKTGLMLTIGIGLIVAALVIIYMNFKSGSSYRTARDIRMAEQKFGKH